MKYQRKRAYAREFGTHLATSLPYIPEDTLIIPVPTASKRIRLRGYDQAVLIAAQLARERSLRLEQVFQRASQVDQIGKHRKERFEQMKHSLVLHSTDKITDASILLIDDVSTTGATLETAARLLRKAGAKHVDAAVIARHLLT